MKKEKITIEYYELNEPQKETLAKLKKILPGSHFVDLKIRYNGETIYFEADFLKDIIKQLV